MISLAVPMVSTVIVAESPSSWSIEDFGTVAALITILGFILGLGLAALGRWRRYWQRWKLRNWLNHTEDLNNELVGFQVCTSEELATSGRANADSGLEKKVSELKAQVRGFRSDLGLERARDDIERALSVICEASDLYARGILTWDAQDAPDARHLNSGGHFAPVVALGPADGVYRMKTMEGQETLEALRRELELRIRTARYQLYPHRLDRWYLRRRHREIKEPDKFESHWAIFQRELSDLEIGVSGGGRRPEKRLAPPETSHASS